MSGVGFQSFRVSGLMLKTLAHFGVLQTFRPLGIFGSGTLGILGLKL